MTDPRPEPDTGSHTRAGEDTRHDGADALGLDDVIDGTDPEHDDEIHFFETPADDENARPL